MADAYDVVIIGGGSAGENVAGRTAPAGLSTVIVESELVGGECSYWACMPSKALLRPGEAVAAARRTPGARSAVTGEIDIAETLKRRDAMTSHYDDKYQVMWLDSVKTDLVRGVGRLAGVRTVEVEASDGTRRTLTANKAVVVSTGSSAAIPPIPGLRESAPWDSRKITTLNEVPDRLVILGGGVVGVEMAQAWKSLGASEVTIIEMAERLVPNAEPFASDLLKEALERDGIVVMTGARATSVTRDGTGVTVAVEGGRTVTASEILVATGRRPVTTDIGLDTVGLEPGKYITVNDHLQAEGVAGGWLYAAGDVNGRALLTHQGKYQARIAGDHIAGKDIAAWADHVAVPAVVFTDPQIAFVGLTEAAARQKGLNISVQQLGLGVAANSIYGEDVLGGVKWIVDEDRKVLVGVTFVGPNAGELVQAATIAIVGEVTLEKLWHAVPAFPTFSEVWLRFLEAYGM